MTRNPLRLHVIAYGDDGQELPAADPVWAEIDAAENYVPAVPRQGDIVFFGSGAWKVIRVCWSLPQRRAMDPSMLATVHVRRTNELGTTADDAIAPYLAVVESAVDEIADKTGTPRDLLRNSQDAP